MRRRLALLALLAIAACSGQDVTQPTTQGTQDAALKASPEGIPIGKFIHANEDARGRQTVRNLEKVERAVWRYYAVGGTIPCCLGDQNAAGKTLKDYLPGKQFLKNAYHGLRTEPCDCFAAVPGQIGYVPVHDDLGDMIGFCVSAYGAYPEQYIEYIRYLPGHEPPAWQAAATEAVEVD